MPDGITGLYVHIPFCDGKCAYCAFYSVRCSADLADRFIRAVVCELNLRQEKFGPLAPRTIYIGGGTPTCLSEQQVLALGEQLTKAISLDRLQEWSIEANPGSLTREKLKAWMSFGVNRVSLGVQSFSNRALHVLGRRHTSAEALDALELVRECGVQNAGIDLIACVPGESVSDWDSTLTTAIAQHPEHISVYALTLEEGTVLARRAGSGAFAPQEDDEQLEQLALAESRLGASGYARYEISNYSLPLFECAHNLSCWRGEQYLGLGPAAASLVDDLRWTTRADLEHYLESLERKRLPGSESERLTPVVRASELLIFGLRLRAGVDLDRVLRQTGLAGSTAESAWRARLLELAIQGLVQGASGRWTLSARGWSLADYVGRELLLAETADLPAESDLPRGGANGKETLT